jgi:hypothetical protein
MAQGKEAFCSALRDPESLVDVVPLEAAPEVECEDILYVAYDAYGAVTGRELPLSTAGLREPIGAPFDEDRVGELYPRLSAKFGP